MRRVCSSVVGDGEFFWEEGVVVFLEMAKEEMDCFLRVRGEEQEEVGKGGMF